MSLRAIFEDSDYELVLMETGYRKPLSALVLGDRPVIAQTLKNHVFLRVKPEFDQFREGLEVCGVARAVQSHPSLMAHHFVHVPVKLSRGNL